MGFLIKIHIAALVILIFYGCGPTSIRLKTTIDDSAYSMFGKTPVREFYAPLVIKDSLVEKWEGEVFGNFNNSSVAVSDSFVFINDLAGRITCLRLDNGKIVGQLKNNGTIASTPVIHKFFVIYADAYDDENISDLIIYDFSQGKRINTAEIPGRILTQLIKTNEGVIFVTENGIAAKYNFLGHRIWMTRTNAFTHSSPALGDDKLIFGNDLGEIIIIDEQSGEILIRKKVTGSFFGSASIYGSYAYIGNEEGNLLAVDLNNAEIKWEFKSGARIIANPVAAENFMVVGNLRGDIYRIDYASGTAIWKLNTGGVINATPFLTKNRIIAADLSGKICMIDVQTGEIKKTFTYPARVRLSPLIYDKYLFIGYDKGILKSYEIFF